MVKSIEESKKIALANLNRLIDAAGSQAHLARMLASQGLDISPQGVFNWTKNKQISKRGAIAAVKHSAFADQFTLRQLRPDVPESEWEELLNEKEAVEKE